MPVASKLAPTGGFAAVSIRVRAKEPEAKLGFAQLPRAALLAASPLHAGREQARSCRRLRRRFMPVASKLAPMGGSAALDLATVRRKAEPVLTSCPVTAAGMRRHVSAISFAFKHLWATAQKCLEKWSHSRLCP
jgi:hypothetical protein